MKDTTLSNQDHLTIPSGEQVGCDALLCKIVMRSKNRRKHYRVINRGKKIPFGKHMYNPCGTNAHWTKDTTSDPSLVTCLRCLAFIKKHNVQNDTAPITKNNLTN